MKAQTSKLVQTIAVGGMLAIGSMAMTGCQVSIGGQTLPSAYYMDDDIQYFPKGPEFKLSREATALKAARNQTSSERAQAGR